MQRDTRPVLFCLPYAGGGASVFSGWQKRLGDDAEVRALQFPGRENLFQLAPLASMDRLADYLMPQVLACGQPFALFGHSLGALVGYELCRRLELAGVVPLALIASARKPPHVTRSARLHALPDDALKQRLRDFGGTPERVLENEAMMQAILPVLRADLRVAETYQLPKAPRLRCRIVACGAEDDALAPPDTLGGWAGYTCGGFELARLTGGHFFLRTMPSRLIALIRKTLESGPCKSASSAIAAASTF